MHDIRYSTANQKGNSFQSHGAHRTSLISRFLSFQPDNSLRYGITDTRLVHRAVCLFTSQLSPVLIAPTRGGMARLSLSVDLNYSLTQTVKISLTNSGKKSYAATLPQSSVIKYRKGEALSLRQWRRGKEEEVRQCVKFLAVGNFFRIVFRNSQRKLQKLRPKPPTLF